MNFMATINYIQIHKKYYFLLLLIYKFLSNKQQTLLFIMVKHVKT